MHKEVLTVRNDPLSPERGEYAFTQTMLRSVAHDLLTRRERNTRHLAVAEHLRRTFPNDGEEVAEVIAAHYRDAYDAARDTPDADTLRTQAVAALARAGKRTHSPSAHPTPPSRPTWPPPRSPPTNQRSPTSPSRRARMATLAGRFAEALALFETVRAAHQEHHRLVDRARTASDAGWALSRLGRIGEGIELMLADVETLEGVDDVALAWLEARLCAALWGSGRNEEATVHVERALALAERHDLPEVKVNALINRGVLHHRASRIQEGLHELTAAVELAEKQGSTYHESIGRLNLGDLLFQADLPGGDEQTQRAVELAHRVGDGFGVSFGHANLAVIRYFTGDWEAAEAAAQQALDTAPDDYERDTQRLPLTLLHIARGRTSAAQAELAALGRLADTDDLQDQASLLVARAAMGVWDDRDETAHAWPHRERHVVLDDHGAYAEGYRLLWPLAAEAALRSGDRDELCELIDKAGNMPGDGLPPYLQAQVGRFRALLAAAEGRHDQVEPSLRAAVDALDELGYPYFRALVQVDLGGWLLTQGRRDRSGTGPRRRPRDVHPARRATGAEQGRCAAGRVRRRRCGLVSEPSDLSLVTCPACGSNDNRAGRKFCSDCGSRLPLNCPSCGAALDRTTQKFCGECGQPLNGTGVADAPAVAAEEPSPAASAAPGGELRWVSVVFVDLVGFTAWSEDREPDVVRELLSGYFERARTVVARYGGEVEKFIGDAVMAVWGARVAQRGRRGASGTGRAAAGCRGRGVRTGRRRRGSAGAGGGGDRSGGVVVESR